VISAKDLGNPQWFPVDVDVTARVIRLAKVDEAAITAASFLDNRWQIDWKTVQTVSFDAIDAGGTERVAWLWHTSFCGSTLLARMLHVSPFSVALREPLVIRRLSDAAEQGVDIREAVAKVLSLIARPWHEGGSLLVKPTHAALNVACRLMSATQGKAIVLTSSLEDFLTSHLKKAPETLAKIPLLTERALGVTRLVERLPVEAFDPPGTLAAIALQWAAQREVVAELLRHIGADRCRLLDWNELQQNLQTSVPMCSNALGLGIPDDALSKNIALHAGTHAKAIDRKFDAQTRRSEAAVLRREFGQQIQAAVEWARRVLLPAIDPIGILPTERGMGFS
jgi:hypothetical protein